LATLGAGYVNLNPMVGAVIVKDGKILGKGFHKKYGESHAEINALADCDVLPEGATLYVNLEPCCHRGKTPPCTDAIIKSGIAKVVIGALDPNPLVSGKGAAKLRESGLEVVAGVLEEECVRLNEVFFHYIKTNKPFVVMKYAMSMDGKIAAHTGKSKWITGDEARENVHWDRLRFSAVMVGVGTVIEDDPLLTCRIENGRNPIRIICDTDLRTPLGSKIAATAKDVPTIIATASSDFEKQKKYSDKNIRILQVPKRSGHVDLYELTAILGKEKIDSIFLEGGGAMNWSALESGIVNKVQAYIAPKIIGGEGAISPVGGLGADSPDNGYILTNSRVALLGDDILIESDVIQKCSQK